jgi:hypothetical protein
VTKPRRPLTFEDAVTKAAAEIGWPAVCEILGKGDRAARNLGDPDVGPTAGVGITLNQALALDVAVRAAGGKHGPFHHCYSTLLDTLLLQACSDCVAIAQAAAFAAKEAGDAICEATKASLPGAAPAQRLIAERELEEAIAAFKVALATLRAGGDVGGALEVAPAPIVAAPAA